MFFPRFIIEPASYTLAVHVPLFLAMFISPGVAVCVAFGTTLGFFIGGFPLVIVVRAASHILFITLGSLYLSRINKLEFNGVKLRIFSFAVALIHAAGEMASVMVFYSAVSGVGVNMSFMNFNPFISMFILVGLGTVIHSMVDFEIMNFIRRILERQRNFRILMTNGKA